MSIYQHFRQEEMPLIKSLESLAERAEQSYAPVLTPFLDPRGCYILTSIVGRYQELDVYFYGGHDGVERKRAMIAPTYYEMQKEDFELQWIEIKYADKFVSINHRNILGALMHLGFERDLLGDIIVGDKVQFVIAKHLTDYVTMQLTKLKESKVTLIPIDAQQIVMQHELYTQRDTTVSSLRLDNIVSSLINKSRAIAKAHIEHEHVKVNHAVVTKPNFMVESEDLLSIKGYGRAKVMHIGDRTKKDKIRITFGTLFK